MKKGSIAARIFWLSAAWLVIALAATAFLLSELYSRALDNSLVDTLDFQIESLAGGALQYGPNHLPDNFPGDPRFARPASGWYWEVRNAEGKTLAFSSSLVGSVLPKGPGGKPAGADSLSRLTDAYGTPIRVVSRDIAISGKPYQFIATGNLAEISTLVDNFRRQAAIVLAAVGAMLAIMSAIVARFALRPVNRLSDALERVREGNASAVDGIYPAEIAPLAEEINELLRSNTEIIERARSQVGNLAHGLKTPIAVLRNEAGQSDDTLSEIVRAQTGKMTDMVAVYLERARLAGRTAVVGRRADTAEVVARLIRVMTKIHPAIGIARAGEGSPPWFRGEKSDLEEIIGNLLDNACKWATGKVIVTLRAATEDPANLYITIEDDGPGLEKDEIAEALKRGRRLDEKTPGSGLGLDIVKELIDVYGGELSLDRSQMGGLRAAVRLPAARPRAKT